ncbi:MAG TPA: SRPBCC family protein [Acidimicrobiales bacterium]|nr:SRPBCC family protein [Acidimicrobiales bacterium]
MGTCERMMRVDAPADVVWAWMSDPRNLFRTNMLHAEVVTDETDLRKGAVITIDHDFFGFYQQRRHARITKVEHGFVAFGEYKAPEVPGRDPFPHQQSFRVVPVDDTSCIIVNSISGRYVFPGSGVLGERLFKRYMPAILDDDNQVVAVGCGALPPAKVKRPPGLILWPLMAIGARFVKKSTRRQLLDQMRTDRPAAPAPGAADAAVSSGTS